MSDPIIDFLEQRGLELSEAPACQENDARQDAVSQMLDLFSQHPDDAALRIERERDALKLIANARTDDRLLWARVGEYDAVVTLLTEQR